MIGAVTLAVNAHLLRSHGLHARDHVLAARIRYCPIEEGAMAGALLCRKTQLLHRMNQSLHLCSVLIIYKSGYYYISALQNSFHAFAEFQRIPTNDAMLR